MAEANTASAHTHEFDVLIVGAGPAGMAAADTAASSSASVALVDENPDLGGQIWRSALDGAAPHEAQTWRDKVGRKHIARLHELRVFAMPEPGTLHAEGPDGLHILHCRKLILATGARERFLPFPGWTLGGVMGAGGLQAMVKSGLPISGKRVVVAGSGPLLLAVAAYLKAHGAVIAAICEQAPLTKLAKFSLALLAEPSKLAQAVRYRRKLRSVPFRAEWWPVLAYGMDERLRGVVLTNGRARMKMDCDYLACGFHLVPNTELPSLLGCRIESSAAVVNSSQESSIPGIYCAGETTGVGGLDKSLAEGAIAGYAATGQTALVRSLQSKRRRTLRFAHALDQAFTLRSELRSLSEPDTFVCRCEDVTYGRLCEHTSWRAAKLHTRCGMGPCQGRICGAATHFLFDWTVDSVRPPAVPVRFGTLAAADEKPSLSRESR